MSTRRFKREDTEKLALTALLTALVAVLSYFGGFINVGSIASINLSLVPVVIGSALYGPITGAWLGAVSGAGVLMAPSTGAFYALSIPGTIITVMVKGILSGLCAGLTYKLLERFNRFVAVVVSAIVCPVVNTGIFLVGCLVFFMDTMVSGATAEGISVGAYLIVVMVGLNFVFELLANIILSPAIHTILNIFVKKKK